MPCRWPLHPAHGWVLLGLLLAAAACGGASAGGAGAETGGEDGWEGPDGTSPHCADGTCFECGDGVICPLGYYCDETAAGGAACAWLPECADEATCSCVTGVLGDACSCDERDGGVYVTCE